MNRRLIRLYNDHKEITEKFRGHPYIEIRDTFGDPPERYLIHYKVKGLVQQGNEVIEKKGHICEIILSGEYPRQEPICRLTSMAVFHPNIAPNKICIADHWAAGESLSDVISRIGEMIVYQNYNIKSPLNGEAARWAEVNLRKFPIDDCNLEPVRTTAAETPEIPHFPIEEAESDKAVIPCSKQVFQCENCGIKGHSVNIEACSGGHWTCHDCMLTCSQCGLKICVLCAFTICNICGSLLCHECKDYCRVCSTVPENRQPEKAYAGNTPRLICSNCKAESDLAEAHQCSNGHLICKNCLIQCSDCGVKMCMLCKFSSCETCKKVLCDGCQHFCLECTKVSCKKHITSCSVCDSQLCLKCIRTCDECHQEFCYVHGNIHRRAH
jgi:hypothetical protein